MIRWRNGSKSRGLTRDLVLREAQANVLHRVAILARKPPVRVKGLGFRAAGSTHREFASHAEKDETTSHPNLPYRTPSSNPPFPPNTQKNKENISPQNRVHVSQELGSPPSLHSLHSPDDISADAGQVDAVSAAQKNHHVNFFCFWGRYTPDCLDGRVPVSARSMFRV